MVVSDSKPLTQFHWLITGLTVKFHGFKRLSASKYFFTILSWKEKSTYVTSLRAQELDMPLLSSLWAILLKNCSPVESGTSGLLTLHSKIIKDRWTLRTVCDSPLFQR